MSGHLLDVDTEKSTYTLTGLSEHIVIPIDLDTTQLM